MNITVLGPDEGTSEASTFETAADFFSLVALAAIYAFVTLGVHSGRSGPLADSNSFEASAGAGAILADTMLVVLEPAEEHARINLLHIAQGEGLNRVFPLTDDSIASTIEWAAAELGQRKGSFSKIQVRLAAEEDRALAFKSYMLLLRRLQGEGFIVEAGL